MPNLNAIANSMRGRMPWTVGRRILQELRLDRGKGWDRTLARLAEEDAEAIPPLTGALTDHILCGEKLVRLYTLDPERLSEFRALAKAQTPTKSAASDQFPLLLSADQLSTAPPGHTLIAVIHEEDGTALIYSSIRIVVRRVQLDAEDFPDSAGDLISKYEEIVGIKSERVQGMDVLWIPSDNRPVQARIDFPRGMLFDAADHALTSLKHTVQAATGVDYLTTPINLFPLIPAMYANPKEGTVVELAFGASTAALKHEKMRRGSFSLRDEAYHRGGLAALQGQISPFKVSIEWQRKLDETLVSTPELNLHSTSRAGGAADPVLFDAVIRDCMGIADFEYVMARIQHYLDTLG